MLVTNQGKILLATIDSGQNKLFYTNAKLYKQDVRSMQEYDEVQLKDLTDEVASAPINLLSVENNTVHFNATFDNAKVTEDLPFNTIGWWAKAGEDGKEVLLAIGSTEAQATLIAGAGGHSTAAISVSLDIAVDSASEVNLVPTEQGAVTPASLQAMIDQLKKDLGVNGSKELPSNDANRVTDDGVYFADTTSTVNLPDGFTKTGYLRAYHDDKSGKYYQTVFDFGNNTIKIYGRSGTMANGTISWQPWHTLDLSGFATKADLKTLSDKVADTSAVTNLQKSLTTQINTKANQTDLQSLINRVSALETTKADHEKRIKTLEDNQWKMVKISEVDYDALVAAGTVDQHTIYDIEGSN